MVMVNVMVGMSLGSDYGYSNFRVRPIVWVGVILWLGLGL